MSAFETWFEVDLKRGQKVFPLSGLVFSQDRLGNKIGVSVFDNGEPVTLSGTVEGSIIRADDTTVICEGTTSNNTAQVILPEAAYAVVGPIQVSIRLIDGNEKTTLFACTGYVHRTKTGTVIDPGSVSNTAVLPALPSANGTYSLKVTINNGVATYAWG